MGTGIVAADICTPTTMARPFMVRGLASSSDRGTTIGVIGVGNRHRRLVWAGARQPFNLHLQTQRWE
jgi:aminoglycoside phosphotransferase